jgi:hypothetical protein
LLQIFKTNLRLCSLKFKEASRPHESRHLSMQAIQTKWFSSKSKLQTKLDATIANPTVWEPRTKMANRCLDLTTLCSEDKLSNNGEDLLGPSLSIVVAARH